MYKFRFNPVFGQWVMLGGQLASPVINSAHLLDVGRRNGFAAATYPRTPFQLEPPESSQHFAAEELVYASQAPTGEYELFLYKGEQSFFSWGAAEWDNWLVLAQHRLLQIHHNPHLHFVQVNLHTSQLESTDPYQRVGDLVATSHPIYGSPPLLEREMADKIRLKETPYTVWTGKWGLLYVPSAPLQEKEIWYIPREYKSGLEQVHKDERAECAEALAKLVNGLHGEHPHEHFVIKLYTAIAGMQTETTWWLQIYKELKGPEAPLPLRPLPENFIQHLRYAFQAPSD